MPSCSRLWSQRLFGLAWFGFSATKSPHSRASSKSTFSLHRPYPLCETLDSGSVSQPNLDSSRDAPHVHTVLRRSPGLPTCVRHGVRRKLPSASASVSISRPEVSLESINLLFGYPTMDCRRLILSFFVAFDLLARLVERQSLL